MFPHLLWRLNGYRIFLRDRDLHRFRRVMLLALHGPSELRSISKCAPSLLRARNGGAANRYPTFMLTAIGSHAMASAISPPGSVVYPAKRNRAQSRSGEKKDGASTAVVLRARDFSHMRRVVKGGCKVRMGPLRASVPLTIARWKKPGAISAARLVLVSASSTSKRRAGSKLRVQRNVCKALVRLDPNLHLPGLLHCFGCGVCTRLNKDLHDNMQ